MSKKIYCYYFTDYRIYKCCNCGRTMHEPVPHKCNGQYVKHNLKFITNDLAGHKEDCWIADKSLEQCKAEHWNEEQYYTNILKIYQNE